MIESISRVDLESHDLFVDRLRVIEGVFQPDRRRSGLIEGFECVPQFVDFRRRQTLKVKL